MSMMRGVNMACFDRAQQAQHVQALVWLVDHYKLTLQLAMEVDAFKNAGKGQAHFQQFETAANLVSQIGKRRKTFGRAPESGGWQQKTASRLRAQAGQPGTQSAAVALHGAPPAAPGSQPVAMPQASPASLSACTASVTQPFALNMSKGTSGNEATP